MARVSFRATTSVGMPGLAIQPRGASALVHFSVDAAGVTPGRVIQVNGLTASAIDTANAAAVAGDTVYFPAGVYTHPNGLVFKDYVTYRGAGIYDQSSPGIGTWIQCSVKWGSHVIVEQMLVGQNAAGVTSSFTPIARAATGAPAGAHTNTNGSHGCLFRFVRFKGGSDTGAALLSTSSNFSNDWGSTTKKIDFYETEFQDCEFERPQSTNDTNNPVIHEGGVGRTLDLWWDCRSGGSQLHDVTFRRCHFGVKNSRAGRTGSEQYGVGSVLLIQPSPAEHAPNGPRPLAGSSLLVGDYVNGWYPGFDWDAVDHGAYNISFIDCLMEFAMWTPMDLCDMGRSYSIWQGNHTGLPGTLTTCLTADANRATGWGNGPQGQWVNIPDEMWLDNVELTRCYLKGRFTGVSGATREICRNLSATDCYGAGTTGSYNNVVSGSFTNANRPHTAIFDVDWTGSGTTYTPSPYDPA